MSKPSDNVPPVSVDLDEDTLKKLERDGIVQWIGLNRKEIARRINEADPMLHQGMLADFVENKIKLPKSAPRKRPEERSTLEDRIRAAYKKLDKGIPAKQRMEQLAKQFNKQFATIENAVRRKV